MTMKRDLGAAFALTADEEASLRAAEGQVRAIRDVLRRLKLAGVDVAAEEAELDRAETIRKGFLSQFGKRTSART